jgi:hypothetical protein
VVNGDAALVAPALPAGVKLATDAFAGRVNLRRAVAVGRLSERSH